MTNQPHPDQRALAGSGENKNKKLFLFSKVLNDEYKFKCLYLKIQKEQTTKHFAACSMLTRSIVYKNVSLPSMTVSREEWKQKMEKDNMAHTIRNPNTHNNVGNMNGYPNTQPKRERFVDMCIVAGTMNPRVNEHWRDVR